MIRSTRMLFALVPFFLVLFCTPVFAQLAHLADRLHLSQDPQVNRARMLVDNGHHQAALAVLRPLFAAQSADTRADIRFLIRLSAIAAANQSDKQQQKTTLLNEPLPPCMLFWFNHLELLSRAT